MGQISTITVIFKWHLVAFLLYHVLYGLNADWRLEHNARKVQNSSLQYIRTPFFYLKLPRLPNPKPHKISSKSSSPSLGLPGGESRSDLTCSPASCEFQEDLRRQHQPAADAPTHALWHAVGGAAEVLLEGFGSIGEWWLRAIALSGTRKMSMFEAGSG